MKRKIVAKKATKQIRKEVKPYSVTGKDGATYYLHGTTRPAYWFSKKVGKDVLSKKPEDRKVKKNTQSGLPFLVRI